MDATDKEERFQKSKIIEELYKQMSKEYTGKVAAVVIPNDEGNRFLVAKREDNGEWEFPGGKHEKNETLLETAEREIKEELCLEIKAKKTAEQYAYRGGGYYIIPVLAEIVAEDFEINLIDHTDYRWIKPRKVKETDINLENERKCLEAFNLL